MGKACAHVVSKCVNCRDSRFAHADGARGSEKPGKSQKGWRPPSPPQRGKREASDAPPAGPPSEEASVERDEMEVEEHASASDEASEMRGRGPRTRGTDCSWRISFVLSVFLFLAAWGEGD